MDDNKRKFKKPPLTEFEKEQKASDFLNNIHSRSLRVQETPPPPTQNRILKKEATVPILLRIPKSLSEDIQEISNITGLSKNAICVELLRPSTKNKLKELKT